MENIQEEGEKPRVIKSSTKELNATVERTAVEIIRKYSEGTVAVIIPHVTELKNYLLKQSWIQNPGDKRHWSKGDLRMSVATPDIARGLEFDGVVVIEQELFPKNLARLGSLYTSLTRANRELAVVHSQGLPNELRQASRR